jgi:hypothetical protein
MIQGARLVRLRQKVYSEGWLKIQASDHNATPAADLRSLLWVEDDEIIVQASPLSGLLLVFTESALP